MNIRFLVFLVASSAAHGLVLGWENGTREPLHLGGHRQALHVSLVTAPAPAPAAVPQPKPKPPGRTAETPAVQPQPPRIAPVAALESGGRQLQVPATPKPRSESPQDTADPGATRPAPPLNGARISAALQERIAAHFEYPWLARKRGWEGRVMLSLRIERDGQLSHCAVRDTSGHAVLDQSALRAAQRIGKLPEAVEWLNGNAIDILLPVSYRLLDS